MALTQVENNDGWKLHSLNITHYSWEKDAPYRGKITFHNKSEEALSFNIPQDKMDSLLALIADSVVDSANRLGHRIAESVQRTINKPLPVLEASEVMPETKKQADDIPF